MTVALGVTKYDYLFSLKKGVSSRTRGKESKLIRYLFSFSILLKSI